MNSSMIRAGFLSFVLVLLCNSTQRAESIDYNVAKTIEFVDDIGEISARARLVVGDLNGDSLPDYVLTNGSRLVKAFADDGELLWRRYESSGYKNRDEVHPVVAAVWDMDGDGKDEVVTFLYHEGENQIVILNGTDGTVRHSHPLRMSRDPYLVIAYMTDTETPRIVAGDEDVKDEVFIFNNRLELLHSVTTDGSGHHAFVYDIDLDGNHEIIAGKYIIDAEGSVMWTLPSPWDRDHVDAVTCVDIHPDYPGPEIVVNGSKGFFMYNFADRAEIWKADGLADPQHQIVGDFDEDDNPEIIIIEKMSSSVGQDMWVVEADGTRNRFRDGDRDKPEDHACMAIDADGDRSRDEILISHTAEIVDNHGNTLSTGDWRYTQPGDSEKDWRFWGNYPCAYDLWGDGREELIAHNENRIIIAENRAEKASEVVSYRFNRDYRLRHVTRNLNRAALFFDFETGRGCTFGAEQTTTTGPATQKSAGIISPHTRNRLRIRLNGMADNSHSLDLRGRIRRVDTSRRGVGVELFKKNSRE